MYIGYEVMLIRFVPYVFTFAMHGWFMGSSFRIPDMARSVLY